MTQFRTFDGGPLASRRGLLQAGGALILTAALRPVAVRALWPCAAADTNLRHLN